MMLHAADDSVSSILYIFALPENKVLIKFTR